MKNSILKIFFWLTIFSVAMAFLESAVVIYLRELYYPNGFKFPLNPIDSHLALTEFLREFATMIMLLGIAYLTADSFHKRFANFIYCFAIWDIFYYVFLKLLINWPESLLTWDILFLIPVTWVGPVISPLILTMLMIILTAVIYKYNKAIVLREWLLLISGSIIVIISFTYDYTLFLINYPRRDSSESSADFISRLTLEYIPSDFNYLIYLLGVTTISLGIIHYIYRNIIITKQS